MLGRHKKAQPHGREYPLPNGMTVRVMPQSSISWKVTLELSGPLETYDNLYSRDEADIIAAKLCERYRDVVPASLL